MSADENTRLAQSAYEAFGRGDMAALAEVMADDIEWVNPGDPSDDRLAGTYRGKDDVLGWFGKLAETLDFQAFERREFNRTGGQGRVPRLRRGDSPKHRPLVRPGRGARLDIQGRTARPFPDLFRHGSGGCRAAHRVAARGEPADRR